MDGTLGKRMVNFYIRSKLSKFRIIPYSVIVEETKIHNFRLISRKMAMFEQLNDQFLVNSN